MKIINIKKYVNCGYYKNGKIRRLEYLPLKKIIKKPLRIK